MIKTDKTLKSLIANFNFNDPAGADYKPLVPYLTGQIKDLKGIEGKLMGNFNAIKTLWQLKKLEDPEHHRRTKARSRVWESTNGYIFLVSWSNASLLRVLGVKWFHWIRPNILYDPLNSSNKGTYRNLREISGKMGYKLLDRLEAQFLDCLRSVIANQEEGFARPQTSSYLDFLGYSQASLKEAKGDVQRAKQDGLLRSEPGSSLKDLGIDLKDWHEALKKSVISKPLRAGMPSGLEAFKFNYPPIDNLDPKKLTYEIFIELINKTDWNLRRLVESLEKKLDDEKMYYKVEQARIKERLKKK